MSKRLIVLSLSAIILLLFLIILALVGLFFLKRPLIAQDVQLSLTADRTSLSPGECTTLYWRAENAPDASLFLDGESVAVSGQKQVCPAGTTNYELKADSGGASFASQLTINVSGASSGEAAGDGEIELSFTARPEMILRGECSTLRWEILSPGEAQVLLQGDELPRSGERQVCPEDSTDYTLEVHQRGQTKSASAAISVIEASSSAPASAGEKETPAAAEDKETPATAAAPTATQQAPAAQGSPQPQPTATTPSGKITTDLAITDLFIKATKANVFMRITNNGPASVSGLKVEIKCNEKGQPVSGGTLWSGVHSPVNLTITLNPGQTAEFDTGSAIDTTLYSFQVTCGLSTGTDAFTDSKISNNNYSEAFPAAAPPGGGSAGMTKVDLAVTDLYPDALPQGKVYARITNNGPGSLSNTGVQLSCSAELTEISNFAKTTNAITPFSTAMSLTPGQTEAVDTHLTVDTSVYWYKITCTVSSSTADPNAGNDSYSETIPPPP
jgi:hypothetical protein